MASSHLVLVDKEWAPYLEFDKQKEEFIGPRGRILTGLWGRQIDRFRINYTKPDDENVMGEAIGNSTYNGVVGMLQRKLADVTIVAEGYEFPPVVIDYIPVAEVYQGKMFHVPDVGIRKINSLQGFNVFSANVWICFLIALLILVLGFVVTSLVSKSLIFHTFKVLRCFLGQSQIEHSLWKSALCATVGLITAFLSTELLKNLLHTDMVSTDYSKVINSIEDVARLTMYKPCFIKDLLTTRFVQKSRNKVHKAIWERVIQSETVFEPGSQVISGWNKDQVWLAERQGVKSISRSMCSLRSEVSKMWFPKEPYFETSTAHYARRDLSGEKRQVIEMRVRRHSEHGLNEALARMGERNYGMTSVSFKCEFEDKIEDLNSEQQEDNHLDLQMFVSVICLLAIGFIASSLTLAYECFRRALVSCLISFRILFRY